MIIMTTLAGLNFRPSSAKEAVDNLVMGDQLFLERDEQNPYDSNAVKVIVRVSADGEALSEEFIGFIPKIDNAEIAEHLDNGGEYTCEVVSFLGTRKPGLKVELTNYGADPDEVLED